MRRPRQAAGAGESIEEFAWSLSLVERVEGKRQQRREREYDGQTDHARGERAETILQIADQIRTGKAAQRADGVDQRQSAGGRLTRRLTV